MKHLLLLLLLTSPAAAQSTGPNFTTGSMTQTVTATQSISETVAIERFGGAVSTWRGDNVRAVDTNDAEISINISDAEFEIVDTSLPWQLEIISRDAGIVETEDITRTIDTDTTTTTMSVFAQ